MLVEFYAPGDPEKVLATATWNGTSVEISSPEDATSAKLRGVFRSTPVVTDDGAYRAQGTSGDVLISPGTLEWFRAVAQVRAPAETGLSGRLVPGVTEGGYDPAAGYRTFEESVARLKSDTG